MDLPTLVKDALAVFGDLFDHDPARHHFAESLTGLMVAETKTVRGIKREFVVTTDQACWHRWLTEAQWEVQALHDRRLAWLPRDPRTRYSPRSVIAIDNPLGEHAGKLLEDVGWLGEHADQRHGSAHDYLISNYVCPSEKHSPIEWRRVTKRDACKEGACKDHTELGSELMDDAMTRAIPGDFTCDGSFSSAKGLHPIHSQQRA